MFLGRIMSFFAIAIRDSCYLLGILILFVNEIFEE